MNAIPTIERLKFWEGESKFAVAEWLWQININELPYRYWMWYVCREYGAAVAVEVGVEQGRTTAMLSAAVTDMVIGVEKDVHRDWIAESLARVPDEQRHPVHIVEGDSIAPETVAQVEALLGNKPIDFLYLDGIHSVEYVREELSLYGPHLAPISLVVCDDLNQPASLGEWFRELPAPYVPLDYLHMLHGHWGPPGPSCGFGALIVFGNGKERLWA